MKILIRELFANCGLERQRQRFMIALTRRVVPQLRSGVGTLW